MSRTGEGTGSQQPTAATCDGSSECKAEEHVHGCFADEGNCDEPAEHFDMDEGLAGV